MLALGAVMGRRMVTGASMVTALLVLSGVAAGCERPTVATEGRLTSSVLTSPTIDRSSTAPSSFGLDAWLVFSPFGDENGLIDVHDDSPRHAVVDDSGVIVSDVDPVDTTPFAPGNPSYPVQLSYQNATGGGGSAVAKVKVTAPLPLCANPVGCGRVPKIFAEGFATGTTGMRSVTLP